MAWFRLTFDVPEASSELAETLLVSHGALSVSLTNAASDPIFELAPGSAPRWQINRMEALFPLDVDYGDIGAALRSAGLPVSTLSVDFLEDEDWENRWRQFAVEVCFADRLWIVPRDVPSPVQADSHALLRLDPGLAFGSGSHPTTRLCLDWLARAPLEQARVLDFGCGSGILALAARSLGADPVVAVDHDPQALLATRENAAYNGMMDERLLVAAADVLETTEPFDVVVANILANPLIQLASQITNLTRPGGMVVLSGLLDTQCAAVAAAYPLVKFADPALEMDEQGACWVRLTGNRMADQYSPDG